MSLRSAFLTILNFLSTFIALILAARIVFLFVGANQATPAIIWINNISSFFMYPFRGLFQSIVINSNSVIDVTAIVALLIYAIVFSILYRIVYVLTRPSVGTTEIRHAEY
jgi:hypothetical protein